MVSIRGNHKKSVQFDLFLTRKVQSNVFITVYRSVMHPIHPKPAFLIKLRMI